MSVRVLLLGGTGHARHLAQRLAAEPNIDVTTALAGQVRTPLLPAGEVRVGGFGGPDGLADWLRAARIDAVVDATHPFATTITGNAVTVTARLGLPLLVLRRPGWQPGPGDNWHWADTLADAATRLPALGRRVFLTTGRRTDLAAFADRGLWLLLRAVDPPEPPTPPNVTLVVARGPFTVAGETTLLRAPHRRARHPGQRWRPHRRETRRSPRPRSARTTGTPARTAGRTDRANRRRGYELAAAHQPTR
jgi:precorrin-6A/cobalt-precorrin-6A reductase